MSGDTAGLTFGNGLPLSRSDDSDGRLATHQLADGTKKLIDLIYAYRDRITLTAVNDNAAPASGMTLGYDPVQRHGDTKGPV